MDAVCNDVTILAEQGKVKGFFNNVGNATKLGGLLEDIRDAMMEYQVCISPNYLVFQYLIFKPDFIATRYLQQQLSAHREFYPFALYSC